MAKNDKKETERREFAAKLQKEIDGRVMADLHDRGSERVGGSLPNRIYVYDCEVYSDSVTMRLSSLDHDTAIKVIQLLKKQKAKS